MTSQRWNKGRYRSRHFLQTNTTIQGGTKVASGPTLPPDEYDDNGGTRYRNSLNLSAMILIAISAPDEKCRRIVGRYYIGPEWRNESSAVDTMVGGTWLTKSPARSAVPRCWPAIPAPDCLRALPVGNDYRRNNRRPGIWAIFFILRCITIGRPNWSGKRHYSRSLYRSQPTLSPPTAKVRRTAGYSRPQPSQYGQARSWRITTQT